MVIKFFSVLSALLLALVAAVQAATFSEVPCAPQTKDEVEQQMADWAGFTVIAVQERLELADLLAIRSRGRTWATHKNLGQYNDIGMNQGINDANTARFGYPDGETSGGYSTAALVAEQRLRNWELSSRISAQLSIDYMDKLRGVIDGFSAQVPRNVFDHNCEGEFRSSHAELKSIVRLMQEGDLPEGQQIFLSVSRHMCKFCREILAHLARNGNRKIFIASPRAGRKLAATFLRPEYAYFDEDGTLIRYRRNNPATTAPFKCHQMSFNPVPNGVDTYIPPDPYVPAPPPPLANTEVREIMRQLNITNRRPAEAPW